MLKLCICLALSFSLTLLGVSVIVFIITNSLISDNSSTSSVILSVVINMCFRCDCLILLKNHYFNQCSYTRKFSSNVSP